MMPSVGRTVLADPIVCRAALDELLGAYGDVLCTTRELPFLSFVRVDVCRSSRADRVESRERRVVVRPVVQHEVRRHSIAALTRLGSALDERWLECDVGEAARDRSALRTRLHEQRVALDRRGPGRRLLDHLPVLPVVGALAVAWLIRPPAARPSGEELYAAFIGIALLLQGRALLVLLTRPFGAQAARALLNGGEVDRGPSAYGEWPASAADRTMRWPLGPAHDVITLENRVHQLCGVPLPRRFPNDLVFTGWHLALVGALVFVALGLALDGARIFVVLGVATLLWCLIGTWSLVAVARRRSSRSREAPGSGMGSGEARYRDAERRLWGSFGLAPTEQRVHLQNLDVTVRVQEIGEGPPVVLIHGASVAGTSWLNMVQGLGGFRCIMLDRPGCGLSDPMPGDAGEAGIDAVKRAGDLLIPDLLDALGLPEAHVLGTSFGGFFALRAAAAAPERVRRVVLYSWSMGVPMDHIPLVMRFAGIPGIGQITARMPIRRAGAKVMLRQAGLRGAIDSGKFNAEMLDWFVALLRYTPTLLNEIRATPKVITPVKGLNQAMLFTDELLARVTSPVYCFWGEDDPNGGAETAKQFVARLPQCTLELVPDAGHAPWIDESERATASTRAFLNG